MNTTKAESMVQLRGLPDPLTAKELAGHAGFTLTSGTTAVVTGNKAIANMDVINVPTLHQQMVEFMTNSTPYIMYTLLLAQAVYWVVKVYQSQMANYRRRRAR